MKNGISKHSVNEHYQSSKEAPYLNLNYQ